MHNQRTTVHLEGDNTHLANFCGPLAENLDQIGPAYDVNIRRRCSHVMIEGPQYNDAAQAVQWFHQRAVHKALSIDDIQLGLVELKAQQPALTINGSIAKQQSAQDHTPNQRVQLSDEAFNLRT